MILFSSTRASACFEEDCPRLLEMPRPGPSCRVLVRKGSRCITPTPSVIFPSSVGMQHCRLSFFLRQKTPGKRLAYPVKRFANQRLKAVTAEANATPQGNSRRIQPPKDEAPRAAHWLAITETCLQYYWLLVFPTSTSAQRGTLGC